MEACIGAGQAGLWGYSVCQKLTVSWKRISYLWKLCDIEKTYRRARTPCLVILEILTGDCPSLGPREVPSKSPVSVPSLESYGVWRLSGVAEEVRNGGTVYITPAISALPLRRFSGHLRYLSCVWSYTCANVGSKPHITALLVTDIVRE